MKTEARVWYVWTSANNCRQGTLTCPPETMASIRTTVQVGPLSSSRSTATIHELAPARPWVDWDLKSLMYKSKLNPHISTMKMIRGDVTSPDETSSVKRRCATLRSRSCHDHEVRYSMSTFLALTQAQYACQSGYASSRHTAFLAPCTDHIQTFGAHGNARLMVSPNRATMPLSIMASEVPVMASQFCLCSVCQGRWLSPCRCHRQLCRAERRVVPWKAK